MTNTIDIKIESLADVDVGAAIAEGLFVWDARRRWYRKGVLAVLSRQDLIDDPAWAGYLERLDGWKEGPEPPLP